MNLADVERYVGIPYDEREFDCADLVCLVQRELFGRDVRLPNGRPRGTEGQAAIKARVTAYAEPVDTPRDGDLVLMRDNGIKRPGHVGVFFHLAHEGYVLHSNETNGCAVLHKVRELPMFGAMIEGWYRWVE